jgi:hypothetical protein
MVTSDSSAWKLTVHSDAAQGKYDFKLLAVDVPTATGSDQRLYLAGDDRIYQRGSIIAELRDPFLQVCSIPSFPGGCIGSCADALASQSWLKHMHAPQNASQEKGLQHGDATSCASPCAGAADAARVRGGGRGG